MPIQIASTSSSKIIFCQSSKTFEILNFLATFSPEAIVLLATETTSTPFWLINFGKWAEIVFPPAPTIPIRIIKIKTYFEGLLE